MTAIVLPPLPPMTHYGGTATVVSPEWLRARDLEVARVVLEAAADIVDDNAAYCSGQTAAILRSNADAIRKMEVRHHE